MIRTLPRLYDRLAARRLSVLVNAPEPFRTFTDVYNVLLYVIPDIRRSIQKLFVTGLLVGIHKTDNSFGLNPPDSGCIVNTALSLIQKRMVFVRNVVNLFGNACCYWSNALSVCGIVKNITTLVYMP